MRYYITPRRLAIGVGILAASAALAILLAEPVATGTWRLEHFLLPAIVAITIAAAHLSIEALRDWRPFAAAGFGLVFIVGTVLTVYSSVGNQNQQTGAHAGEAEAHNQAIADKRDALRGRESDLAVTKALLLDTQRQLQADCVVGKKPKGHCDGVRTNVTVYTSAIAGHEAAVARLEADLRALGGKHVARPRAEGLGELVDVLGYDRAKVERIAAALEPFAFSLLFELCSIVAFGYGFGGNRAPAAKVGGNRRVTVTETPEPTSPKPVHRPVAVNAVATRAGAEADVIRLLARGQPLPSQEALRMRWGLKHRATVSKWLSDFEARGLIAREAEGRCKVVRAATA